MCCHRLAMCHWLALCCRGAALSSSVIVPCHRRPCPGHVGCVLVLGARCCWCMVVVLVAVCQWWWWALIAVRVVGGPSLLFVSLHCLCIITICHGVHGGRCRRGTWIVSSGGVEVVFYSLGWLKTTRR